MVAVRPTKASTFGSITHALGGHGFRLSDVRLPERLRLRPHAHQESQLCFVFEGSYLEQTDRHSTRLQPGSVLFRPAAFPHANEVGAASTRVLLIDFSPAAFPGLTGIDFPQDPVYLPAGELAGVGAELRHELKHGDQFSRAAVAALIQLAVLRLLRWVRDRNAAPLPAWYMAAVEIVYRRFAQNPQTSFLAKAIGVPTARLAEAFRRYQGRSVRAVVQELRLAEARRRLLETGESIAQIAHGLGYFDQSHFGRQFRRRFRISPAEYRKTGGSVH